MRVAPHLYGRDTELHPVWLCWSACVVFCLCVQAVVIAAALSMSSSAFVLQLLSERGESATRTGSATLGILLFQVRGKDGE